MYQNDAIEFSDVAIKTVDDSPSEGTNDRNKFSSISISGNLGTSLRLSSCLDDQGCDAIRLIRSGVMFLWSAPTLTRVLPSLRLSEHVLHIIIHK